MKLGEDCFSWRGLFWIEHTTLLVDENYAFSEVFSEKVEKAGAFGSPIVVLVFSSRVSKGPFATARPGTQLQKFKLQKVPSHPHLR